MDLCLSEIILSPRLTCGALETLVYSIQKLWKILDRMDVVKNIVFLLPFERTLEKTGGFFFA